MREVKHYTVGNFDDFAFTSPDCVALPQYNHQISKKKQVQTIYLSLYNDYIDQPARLSQPSGVYLYIILASHFYIISEKTPK